MFLGTDRCIQGSVPDSETYFHIRVISPYYKSDEVILGVAIGEVAWETMPGGVICEERIMKNINPTSMGVALRTALTGGPFEDNLIHIFTVYKTS